MRIKALEIHFISVKMTFFSLVIAYEKDQNPRTKGKNKKMSHCLKQLHFEKANSSIKLFNYIDQILLLLYKDF